MKLFTNLKSKLFFLSVLISLLITGFLSILEIQRDINEHKSLVKKELIHFEAFHKPYIIGKVWAMEYDDLKRYVIGEVAGQWFDSIEIIDIKGEMVVEAGESQKNSVKKTIELTYHHNNKNVIIGKVVISGKVPGFFGILKQRWGYTFFLNGISVLFVFICSYFFLYRKIFSRLVTMTEIIKNEDYKNIKTIQLIPTHEKKEDEIDLLANAFNERTRLLKDELKNREKIETSLEFRALLLSQIHDHVIATDLDGNITYVNQAASKGLRRDGDEIIGKPIKVFGDDLGQSEIQSEIIGQTLKNGAWRGEIVIFPNDGTTLFMDCRMTLIKDKLGNPVNILGVSTDITTRKKSETEKELLLTAIEQSPETIVITDADGNIQYANSAFEDLTGYQRKHLIGHNPRILKSGEHDKEFYRRLWQTISSGSTWKGNITNRSQDGRLFTEEATISPVHDSYGKIINYVAVKRDITEQLRMESQIAQSQKMETIGTLAGGIAHDFNNILFPIIGHTEMLLEDVSDSDKNARNSLNQIYSSAFRAKELVQQILTFARQENAEYKPLKVQLILKESLKLLRSTIPTNIEINQSIDSDCSAINADATQIHQVIMNLMTNAYHAMTDTGAVINVELNEIAIIVPEKGINHDEISPGSYVCLTITDSGVGIPSELIRKIFDPFFTTKEKGKGTGMGLSVVHGIVKRMGGYIKLKSAIGKGSEFKVYFPVLYDRIEDNPLVQTVDINHGTERILLVDDEEPIVKLEKQMLERLGYQVSARTSSYDGLEAFRANPDGFDLVISDMSMPKMTGEDLAKKILAIKAATPIIICTGFSDNLTENKIRKIGISGLVMKPVVRNDLAKEIRRVLDMYRNEI